MTPEFNIEIRTATDLLIKQTDENGNAILDTNKHRKFFQILARITLLGKHTYFESDVLDFDISPTNLNRALIDITDKLRDFVCNHY